MNINHLPNDVIEKIRREYFELYVKPTMLPVWRPVLGCKIDRNKKIDNANANASFECIAQWALLYLKSFHPLHMLIDRKFREYILQFNKYIWVDTVYIEVKCDDMTHVKLIFQQYFDVVEICKNKIRIDFKTEISDWVTLIMNACDIDMALFEWKPLLLKIDVAKELAYFEDPSDGRRSRIIFGELDYDLDYIENIENIENIPWFVFIP